jgi:O-methyltransferase/methyltransferase family protein
VADLDELAGGLWHTQLLHVAARLGIADRVASGPRSAAELARETGADADALFRVLRALAALGVLSQDAEDRFGPTPVSERLRSGAPGSVHARLLLYGEPWWWAAVGGLYETVMTGETAFDRVHGAGLFAWLEEHPAASAVFDAEMSAMTAAEAEAVVLVAELPETGTVVDVAGGRGTLLTAILRARPGLRGVLFDQPHVVAAAALPERCEAVAGSFFEAVPAGAEAYALKDILHDWDDERALGILRTIRAAIPEHGRLLVIERALPPGDEPAPGKLVDITMLLITGGRERTRSQYEALLARAGFRLASVAPTPAGTDVVTALPSTA